MPKNTASKRPLKTSKSLEVQKLQKSIEAPTLWEPWPGPGPPPSGAKLIRLSCPDFRGFRGRPGADLAGDFASGFRDFLGIDFGSRGV